MTTPLENYKNIDKSTDVLLDEPKAFKVFTLSNSGSKTEQYITKLNDNYIQLFLCAKGNATVAFNMEHCAIPLKEKGSNMVYFKDEKMNLLYKIEPKAKLFVILIPIDFFHSLFSIEGNFLFNFRNFKIGQPIIEPKEITTSIQLILNQLEAKNITNSLRPMYVRGKVYELLSHYFNTSQDVNSEYCPYIANEETVGKIKHAKEIIIKEMNNPPSLTELAKMVGLNIKKLKNGFKEFYGTPVFSFLLNYKMELAKKLLQEQQLNVNEVASQLGYSTSSHFIAAFKRKYGITPKQFSKS